MTADVAPDYRVDGGAPAAGLQRDGEVAASGGESAKAREVQFAGGRTNREVGVGGHFEDRGVCSIVRRHFDLVRSGRNPAQRTALDDDLRIAGVVDRGGIDDQRTVGGAVQADDNVDIAVKYRTGAHRTALEVPGGGGGVQTDRVDQRSTGEGKVVDGLRGIADRVAGRGQRSAVDDFHVVTDDAVEIGQCKGRVDVQNAHIQRGAGSAEGQARGVRHRCG